jgi:hypothetical protein
MHSGLYYELKICLLQLSVQPMDHPPYQIRMELNSPIS